MSPSAFLRGGFLGMFGNVLGCQTACSSVHLRLCYQTFEEGKMLQQVN